MGRLVERYCTDCEKYTPHDEGTPETRPGTKITEVERTCKICGKNGFVDINTK